MNSKCKSIMEEYNASRRDFAELGNIVSNLLKISLNDAGIRVMAVEHRIKEEGSLARKLELKGDKYSSLDDVTDILGARIICYFSDDVDRVAELMQSLFVIDSKNTVDKRASHNPDSFGYLSLHYIVSLPDNGTYAENLTDKKFEIQIRSILQHTWAAINHDLGYKSEFGVPKNITRAFSRVAGLLEIADDQFVNIRDTVSSYSQEIKRKIANNEARDVLIDMVSLREYIRANKQMKELVEKIASICNCEICEIDPQNYIEQLTYLEKYTIGDLQNMVEENSDLAFELAEKSLENSQRDLLPSSIGLRYLCRAELLNKNYPLEKIVEFINISVSNEGRAGQQAMRLMKTYNEITKEN